MSLHLDRKEGEVIYIGDDIKITFRHKSNGKITFLIDAPKDINIARAEILHPSEIERRDKAACDG
mgnify:CR=1 FL=1